MVNTDELIQGHTPIDYTKESVKLVRNSKGYTWEIKLVGTQGQGTWSEGDFERLKQINADLENEWGREE